MLDKELIKKRFKQSLSTYNSEAIAQQKMNVKLCEYLSDNKFQNPLRLLEIGCGAGNLTQKIIEITNIDKMYLNDIVDLNPEHLGLSDNKINCQIISGDAEEINFPEKLDLVISGATFQWFENLDKVLDKVSQALKPGGILLFSTFGKQNLIEIRNITGKGLSYLSINEIHKKIRSNFDIVKQEEESIELWFSDAKEVMQHLKKTGVNAVSVETWTKEKYRNFIEKYEDYKTKNAYRLTYHPMYFLLKKK